MDVAIHTMSQKVYEGRAREVILPGEDGDLSVLDFHQPCVYSLTRGRITVIPADRGAAYGLEITRGIANIRPDALTLLVEP